MFGFKKITKAPEKKIKLRPEPKYIMTDFGPMTESEYKNHQEDIMAGNE